MDILLELLTNPKPITKRNGQNQGFEFQKFERSVARAFRDQNKNDETMIRHIVEEALKEFGSIYTQEPHPKTSHLRQAILLVLEKQGLHDIKEAYEKNQKTSTPPSPIAPATPTPQTTTPTMSLPPVPEARPSTIAPITGEVHVARRRRLNEERKAVTHKFQVGAYEGYLIVGLYDDGQPGEIFLRMNKEGSMLSGLMDSFATAVSIGLQYGVPLKVLVKKFAGVHFEPNGPTQNPNIPHARSIMDYIFRWLAVKFLTPEERQTVLGLHIDDQGMETMEVSNVDGARQSRLLDRANA